MRGRGKLSRLPDLRARFKENEFLDCIELLLNQCRAQGKILRGIDVWLCNE